VCEEAGISYGSCKTIVTKNMRMRHVSAKVARRVLTQEVLPELTSMAEGPFL
jgi:hypothetical protein